MAYLLRVHVNKKWACKYPIKEGIHILDDIDEDAQSDALPFYVGHDPSPSCWRQLTTARPGTKVQFDADIKVHPSSTGIKHGASTMYG